MLLIFDLDGTILDTYPLIRETFIRLFRQFLPEYQYEETDLQSFFGPGLLDTFARIGCNEDQAKHLFREYRKLNVALQSKYLRMFPNTREVLQMLKDDGYKMAILSNKINEAITSNLKQMNLLSFFDLIIGIDQVKNPKPHREGVDLIKKIMNIEKCIYIGDAKTDMITAINAGIDGIGARWALTSREDLLLEGAKYVASDMKDLLKIVRENYV